MSMMTEALPLDEDRDKRAHVLAEAIAKHPERFPNGRSSSRPRAACEV